MRRISTATKHTDKFGAGKHGFRNGDAVNGIAATDLEAELFDHLQEEIANVIEGVGTPLDANNRAQLLAAINSLIASKAVGIGYMLVRDEKASGTHGGTTAANTTYTRGLNTVVRNTIAGASLSGNQITLPPGTYRIRGSAPACNVDAHRAWFYNVSDALSVVLGTSEQTSGPGNGDAVQTRSLINGSFVITAQKIFELRHSVNGAVATIGLGYAAVPAGNEIYAEIEIIKEA